MRVHALAFALAAACPALSAAADSGQLVSYSRQANFDDVRDDLKAAIEAKGLVIDHHAYIHRMLERTGRDVGSSRKLYHDAQAFTFCSAALSRRTMEADPGNIAFCPYSIVVYALAPEPGKVFIAYRRPARVDGSAASKTSLKEVEMLLDGIARQALGIK